MLSRVDGSTKSLVPKMSDLNPRIWFDVVFDGDDDPQIQLENFLFQLDIRLKIIMNAGYCRSISKIHAGTN
jgi:hypothetical protein